jgi:hypothetical protein
MGKLQEIFNHRIEMPDGLHADGVLMPEDKSTEVARKSLSPDDLRNLVLKSLVVGVRNEQA